jgi:[histone H3]-lysine4 N-trimethyltransferase SETD1
VKTAPSRPHLARESSGALLCLQMDQQQRPPQAAVRRNYKLLSDPFITKGAHKVYRYNGIVPNDNTAPPIQTRDPRSALTKIWTRLETLDLPVPRFKVLLHAVALECVVIYFLNDLQIDEDYVGEPPPLEVTISNLNDNIDKTFLSDLVSFS